MALTRNFRKTIRARVERDPKFCMELLRQGVALIKEVEALIQTRLKSGKFKDAEDVILQALQTSGTESPLINTQRDEAIEHLRTFGETHRLSLGGMTIRELRHEART